MLKMHRRVTILYMESALLEQNFNLHSESNLTFHIDRIVSRSTISRGTTIINSLQKTRDSREINIYESKIIEN